MSSTVTRLAGLSSGLDTEALVRQLMNAENMRLDKLNQKKQLLTWKQESYREVADTLKSFQNSMLSLTSKTTIRMPSVYKSYKTTVTGRNNESTVGITVSAKNPTQNDSYTMTVNALAQKDVWHGAAQDNNFNLDTSTDHKNASGQLKINAVTIAFDDNASYNDVMKAINESDAGVNIFYDDVSQQFKLESKTTGKDAKITIGGNTTALQAMKLAAGDEATALSGTPESAAADAEITFNGRSYTSANNNFEINGIAISLTGASLGKTVDIEVTRDISGAVDAIKNFVDEYNKLMASLYAQTGTSRPKSGQYSYYEPLTTSQRESMGEKEIEQWEAKAKTGMLYRDDILTSMQSQMRTWMYASVPRDGKSDISLYNIGITTSSEGGNIGLLQIDEEKLTAMLEKDPDAVSDLFTKRSGMVGGSKEARAKRMGVQGLAERLNDIIDNAVGSAGSIYERAGLKDTASYMNNDLYRELKKQEDSIYEMTQRLLQKENNYYSMFAKMENALSEANSQTNALSGLI